MQTDNKTLDFYFDFSSPYAYIAAEKIEPLALKQGYTVQWKPILLGVVFQQLGVKPFIGDSPKTRYVIRDFARSAHFHGLPYQHPARFPLATQIPACAFYWLHNQNPVRAKQLAQAFFRAYFVEGLNISDLETTLAIAAHHGIASDALRAALIQADVKEKLKQETAQAIENGVFGSPFFLVGQECFWGADRLDQLERWLACGGW